MKNKREGKHVKEERESMESRKRRRERRRRRRRINHRADSACLCFHFPPQERQSRGRQREEWEKRGRWKITE